MSQNSSAWTIVDETSSKGPSGYMKILTRRYRLPDGRTSDWDLLDGGETVAVLALTRDDDVLLARQFRPGPSMELDEMPGGYVDEGESILTAASRELFEETGYVSDDIEIVGSTYLSATAVTKRYVAVARACTARRPPENADDEFTIPVLKPLDNFRAQVRAGLLTDTDLAYLALDHLGLL
ncbi:NUDIX hydrolase [Mycobacterium sp. 3519A]|uniref:NUDIX hydrolase n=1 Tax=Mycobacterium sp. 3519A TaxID=2057184 RepID=UPI000C7D2129|nr:NUDIX hydrolase [Mycobacterium sp. 3519A]